MLQGFHITTMQDTFDLYKYEQVLWKGFNHEINGEGEFKFTKEDEQEARESMIRANVNLNLKVAVVLEGIHRASLLGAKKSNSWLFTTILL